MRSFQIFGRSDTLTVPSRSSFSSSYLQGIACQEHSLVVQVSVAAIAFLSRRAVRDSSTLCIEAAGLQLNYERII